MANHASALKRIRSSEKIRQKNRYQNKTTKTFIKKLKKLTNKKEAIEQLKTAYAMLDKLAKKRIIHPNQSARRKAQISKHVHALA